MYSKGVSEGWGATEFYLTDMTRIVDGKPGTWQWGDGTILDYDRWGPNYPSSSDWKRMRFAKHNQLMSDTNGNFPYHFVCEITQHIYYGKQRLHLLLHLNKG